jgi:hypothetical protein
MKVTKEYAQAAVKRATEEVVRIRKRQLLTEAAPDLLDACILCRSMLSVWAIDPDKSPNTILSTLMPALDEAISKAEGGK